jgi:hypothetical protein
MSDITTLATTATPSTPPAGGSSPAPSQPAAPAVAKPVPGSKEFAALTTGQRHEQLRGPPNPRAVGHSPKRDQMEEAAARDAGEGKQQREAPSGDPQTPSADGTKFKVGKFEVSEGEIASMLDRQAQDDLRKATLPPTPEAYKLALPENLTLPGDAKFQFDEAGNKATFDAAKAWAHSRGLSQGDFSEMMGIYASHVAQQEAALAAISRAEIAKAGVNAPQRVDAIGKWIRGEVGDADAKPILSTLVTDAHLRFFEKLQQRITSQGAASFSASHRVAPDSNDIPGFDKMTFEQRRFAQDQNAARRR